MKDVASSKKEASYLELELSGFLDASKPKIPQTGRILAMGEAYWDVVPELEGTPAQLTPGFA